MMNQKKTLIRFNDYQFTPTKEEAYTRAERAINVFITKNLPKKKDGGVMTPEELMGVISSSSSSSSSTTTTNTNVGATTTTATTTITTTAQIVQPVSTEKSSGLATPIAFIHLKEGNSTNRASGSLIGPGGAGLLRRETMASGELMKKKEEEPLQVELEFALSYTQLTTLPPQIYTMVWLQKLVLTHHNIKSIDEEIGKLQQLQVLVLENNRLTSLPNSVGDLVNLRRLEADNNHLVSLCQLEKLNKLELLSLNNNKLTLLPTSIASLASLKTLNIKSNPIITPPSTIVARGLKDIVAFLRELETGARPCLRSKLIVVGDNNVGKTSVIQSVKGTKKKKERVTEQGIEIDTLEFDAVLDEQDGKRRTITVLTWDINTHDVYYATNQLFASERCVHVIVWDLTKSLEDSNIEYWLHSITSVAPNSPIILVGTHIDAFDDTSVVNAILERAASRFQQKFATIQAIISVSCTTGYDVDRLRTLLEDIIKQQRYLREKVPSSFFTLEEALIEVRKKRTPPIMMWQEYISLANICNLKDVIQIQRATEFLHNIGSIVYFNDPNSTVGKMVILDQQWIINCMTALITAKLTKNGIIRTTDLSAIWKAPAYPEHLQPALLSIMQAFEITYPLSQGDLVKSDELFDPFASSSSLASTLSTITGIGTVGALNHTTSNMSLLSSMTSTTSAAGLSLSSSMTTASVITQPAPLAGERHLVPNLLADTGNIVSQWEDFNDPDVIRLNRQYHLPFIPEKFFGKLIIRLIHFVKVEACLKKAVIVRNAQGHEALIELKNNKDHYWKKVLTVDVRGLPTPVGLLRTVTDTIESLLSQWYKLDIKRCICCYECTFLFDQNPTLFTIEECELAVMDGKTVLNCFKKADEHEERTTHRLKLDILAPDIAMLDIPRPRFDLKEVKLLKEVGRGAFGVVYEAEWNGEIVALKKLILRTVNEDSNGNTVDLSIDEQIEDRLKVFREFRHEVYSMSRLSHPNCMRISGFCLQPSMCMALEYVKFGSLYSALSNPMIEFSWGLRLQIASEIAKGMQHMHSINPPMIHRDLKSPNILMHCLQEGGAGPVSTIIDYGTSTALYGGAALIRCVDQPLWLAPEVMASMAYSEPSDVYSFGIILWELIARTHPFDEYQFGQWMSKLEDEIIRGLRPTIPPTCPPEYMELIQSCWTHEPNSRPTFTSIVETLTNLKKKYVQPTNQSSLPPHIRFQTRKSRSSSFSETMLSGSFSSNLSVTPITVTTTTNGLPSINESPTSERREVRTLSTSLAPGTSLSGTSVSANNTPLMQPLGGSTSSTPSLHPVLHHTVSFATTVSSNSSLRHSQSSSEILIEDTLTIEDLNNLDIFTEEENEQPYPFSDDDQQRGILFGFDEEQASSMSIVVAATLAKMIEMMTRTADIPVSSPSIGVTGVGGGLPPLNISTSGTSNITSGSQLNISQQSSSMASSSSGGGGGRKRSDTAGRNLQAPNPQSWRNSIPLTSGALTMIDEAFIDDFIYVYRSFTTPVKVFKMLVRRYFGPRSDRSDLFTMRKWEQKKASIRAGTSNFLKRWVSDITELEFKQDDCWLYHKVFEFTNTCLSGDLIIANSIISLLLSFENISKTLVELEKSGGLLATPNTGNNASLLAGVPTLTNQLKANENISKSFLNLAIHIRDPLYGIPLREKKFKNNKIYTRCFTGADCIDWLMKITSVQSREDGKTIAMDMYTRQFIYLLSEDGNIVNDIKGGNKIEFYDSNTQFYTFLDDDTELVAQQFTFLELKYQQDIHTRELLGFSVGLATNDITSDLESMDKWKQANFPHIFNYFKWFNKMSLLVASEIVKQRDFRKRADVIERYIKVALEYLSLWNFNGVMQVLSALHSEPIARLNLSWSRVPAKYVDCFIDLSRLMLPESNYQPLRSVLLQKLPGSISSSNYPNLVPFMTHSTCPTIPFLGALIADLSQTSTENPTFISSNGEKMTNILRVKRISKKMKMFKEYKEMLPFYRPALSSMPLVWYTSYMNEMKAFDYNQVDRLSEIERKIEIEVEKSGAASDDMTDVSGNTTSTDSLGFGNEELTDRDWAVLLTNAAVITYHRGDVVIEENTINSYLYRIKSGILGVEKKNKDGKSVKVSTMIAPKMFGEMSFLGNKTTARVVVDEQADLYVMDIPFLNSLFVSHPRLGAKFYKIMANQLATRLKNLPWSKPQAPPSPVILSPPPIISPISSTPPSSGVSPLVSSLASNFGGVSPHIMSPPPPLVVPTLQIEKLASGTPPASPRTNNASPNPFLANVHPHLQHRASNANFMLNTNSIGNSTPRGEGGRSNSVSRTLTLSNIGRSSDKDKEKDKDKDKDATGNEHLKKGDQEFCQRFSLMDEIVIKDYPCSLNRSGRFYISQGHVCFYSKFFGYKTKKVIPFKQIEKLLCVNTNQLELTRLKNTNPTNYRFTFQNTKDRQDAYGIINSLSESAKIAGDDIKNKLKEERKKQHMTLKPKNQMKQDQLTKEDWELIGREGSRCHIFKKDEPIVKQGDRIQKIFQIGKGVCRIEKSVTSNANTPANKQSTEVKTVVLGTMKQDETFGEITYLLSGEVTATVVADSADGVEVYAIEGQFVNILFDLNPALATRWFKYLATALNKTLIERETQLYN